MSFTPAALTKSWENPADFPTYEEREDQVRADMQILFTELKDCINRLIEELEKTNSGASGAGNIGISEIVGLENYDNVQDALAGLMQAVNDVSIGVLADHSVSSAKLSRTSDPAGAAVETENIKNSAVTSSKIANEAVTNEKVNLRGGGLSLGKVNTYTFLYGTLQLMNGPNMYGTTLPSTSVAGRIFFKKIE